MRNIYRPYFSGYMYLYSRIIFSKEPKLATIAVASSIAFAKARATSIWFRSTTLLVAGAVATTTIVHVRFGCGTHPSGRITRGTYSYTRATIGIVGTSKAVINCNAAYTITSVPVGHCFTHPSGQITLCTCSYTRATIGIVGTSKAVINCDTASWSWS